MTGWEFLDRVAELRRQGRTPKEIARALGLTLAEVTWLIRTVAAEDASCQEQRATSWEEAGRHWREAVMPYGLGDGAIGDVVTAIMDIDSRLRVIHGDGNGHRKGSAGPDMLEAFSLAETPESLEALVDGYCTVIYSFTSALVRAYEDGGKEMEDALSRLVQRLMMWMKRMPQAVPPPLVPTMIALVTSSALGISPQRWKEQYGDWSADEILALRFTAMLIADWTNELEESPDAALCMIVSAYEQNEADRIAAEQTAQEEDEQDERDGPSQPALIGAELGRRGPRAFGGGRASSAWAGWMPCSPARPTPFPLEGTSGTR